MPITQKTVFVTSDGETFDNEAEARAAEGRVAIANDILGIKNDLRCVTVFMPCTTKLMAEYAHKILPILRRHLEPEQGGAAEPLPPTQYTVASLIEAVKLEMSNGGMAFDASFEEGAEWALTNIRLRAERADRHHRAINAAPHA